MAKRPAQLRHWCFTIGGEEAMTINGLEDLWDSTCMNFLCGQLEYTQNEDEEDNFHWQGYVQFHKSLRFTQVKKYLKSFTAHVEEARGTLQENIDYCTKKQSQLLGPKIFGKPVESGERTDIERMYVDVKSGKPMAKIIDHHTNTWFKYHGAVDKAKFYLEQESACEKRTCTVTVWIDQGQTGKTTRAMYYITEDGKMKAKRDVFRLTHEEGRLWWDGYDGQKTLVIDDCVHLIKFDYWKSLVDGHPMRIQIKNGWKNALWDRVSSLSLLYFANLLICLRLWIAAASPPQLNLLDSAMLGSSLIVFCLLGDYQLKSTSKQLVARQRRGSPKHAIFQRSHCSYQRYDSLRIPGQTYSQNRRTRLCFRGYTPQRLHRRGWKRPAILPWR